MRLATTLGVWLCVLLLALMIYLQLRLLREMPDVGPAVEGIRSTTIEIDKKVGNISSDTAAIRDGTRCATPRWEDRMHKVPSDCSH